MSYTALVTCTFNVSLWVIKQMFDSFNFISILGHFELQVSTVQENRLSPFVQSYTSLLLSVSSLKEYHKDIVKTLGKGSSDYTMVK